MGSRTRYEANVCVLLHRDGRWLLAERGPQVSYAPGQLGMLGGHVEPDVEAAVFEATARREVAEEAGLDLTDVALEYLTSELYLDGDQPVLTVTFVAELPAGSEPTLSAPDELSAIGWWSLAELASVPNCAPWVPPLVAAAEELLSRR